MTMTSWKRLAPAALAGVVFASLPLPAAAQTPIKIGASMSVTGTYAKPGTYQKQGYDVCIDELNAKGGILGRKVELVDLRRPVHPRHRGAALREADHRGQGGRGHGALLLGDQRGGRQRDREVQEGHGRAARRHHLDLQEGPQVHLHGDLPRRGLPGRADRHGGQARAQDGRHHQRGHALPQGVGRGHRGGGQEEGHAGGASRRPTRRGTPTSRRCWSRSRRPIPT